MKIRKPLGPSERCGVIIAEKIFASTAGPSPLLLSQSMPAIIQNFHAEKPDPAKTANAQNRPPSLTAARKGKAARVKGARVEGDLPSRPR